jgi:hypothetical protein
MASAIVNDETFRLVHQVFLSQSERPPGVVVLFADMDHGAACSQICASVAETLARAGLGVPGRANFRSPAEPGLFGATDDPGLPDALTRMGPTRSFMRPVGP